MGGALLLEAASIENATSVFRDLCEALQLRHSRAHLEVLAQRRGDLSCTERCPTTFETAFQIMKRQEFYPLPLQTLKR